MASRHLARNANSSAAKEFIKILERIDYSKQPWTIFQDWTLMAAAAIHNRVVYDQAIEDAYLDRARHYKPEALTKMGTLLGIAMAELVNNPRDFLGEVFEASLQSNANLGQFFTPWSISLFLARLSMDPDRLTPDRIITISEPACGAGGMVMAACAVLAESGINYSAQACIYAQDIDATCARMTYIQLALSGAAAIVSSGDTLRNTLNWAWPTPAYILNNLGSRLALQRQIDDYRAILAMEPVAVPAAGPEEAESVSIEPRPSGPGPVDIELPAARGEARQLDLFEVSA